MRRLEVLFLPHPVAAIATPWTTDVIEAVSVRHNLRLFDRTQPAAPQLAGIEAIVDLGGNISADLLAAAADAGVKFLQVQTTGLDHVDVEGILNTGLLLAHCPGQLSSVALAQSAMMFILMHAHRYGEARRNFDAGRLYSPTGIELEGLTLGLIGFGASAQDLARRAKPFGLRILAIDIRPIEEEILAEIQPEFLGGPEDVDRVVAESDYLSLHLHLTPETRHTIDARRIGLMKETACLINVARGALVDEDALYRGACWTVAWAGPGSMSSLRSHPTLRPLFSNCPMCLPCPTPPVRPTAPRASGRGWPPTTSTATRGARRSWGKSRLGLSKRQEVHLAVNTLITGASSGIGETIARRLAAAGHRVALMARRAERVQALAAELDGAVAVPGDVGIVADCEAAVRETVEAFGSLDALVNAAGTWVEEPLAEVSYEEVARLCRYGCKRRVADHARRPAGADAKRRADTAYQRLAGADPRAAAGALCGGRVRGARAMRESAMGGGRAGSPRRLNHPRLGS